MSKKSRNQAYVVKLEQKLATIKTGYSLAIKSRNWCIFMSRMYFLQ